ncbi:ABC transporter permease [Acuticoccus sediminis]|nr:ABC transporter permease [Acuticoccus sediminis]
MKGPPVWVAAVAVLVLVFLQLPVIVVAMASVSTTSYLTVPPVGFTLDWFVEVLTDRDYIEAIQTSFLLAFAATAGSLVLGTAASYALHHRLVPGADALASFFMAPLIFPAVVIGVALLQYYSLVGLRWSFWGLLLAHIAITVPYVIRACLTSLAGVKSELEEAARVLGASGFNAFRLVTLPLLKPGLVAGAFFAFITSLDNVPVTIFLLGPRQSTLPVKIFTSIEHGGVDPGLAAISTLLILVTGLALVIAERWVGFSRFV